MRAWSRFFATLALGAASLFAPAAASAQPKAIKIIVVDVRRAILDTEEGLRVQASLKRLYDVRQRDLSVMEQQFQQKQQTLNQQVQAGTPQAQLGPQLQALQQLYVELNQRKNDYTNEMSAREQQLTGPIYTRILALVRKVALQQGADVIFDRQLVAYYKAEVEITDRVIQMYNNGETANVTATGAPPILPPPPANAPKVAPAPSVTPPPKKP